MHYFKNGDNTLDGGFRVLNLVTDREPNKEL